MRTTGSRPCGPSLLVAVLAATACARPVIAPRPLPSVPAARLARLARAANLTRWSIVVGDHARSARGHDLSDADAELIRRLGFTGVRLVVPLDRIFNPSAPGHSDSTTLAELDRVLDRLLAQDLGVIIDPHPASTDRQIETDSAYAGGFVRFWSALATHLSRRDPERVFLEVINEPVYEGRASQWPGLQARVLAAMRAAAPAHTLIATGTGWSSIEGLLHLAPVADGNVVYTFHFYEPFVFTHQGEGWAQPPAGKLRGVPYPVDNVPCAAFAVEQRDSSAARAMRRYCAEGWNAATIERRLAKAKEWSRQHEVPVLLGEFGASSRAAPPAARAAWIRDVRMAAERLGIGWAIWSFDDRFGLGARPGPDGNLVVDASVVRALGLRSGGALLSRAR
ncbi:MAG TPA: cellulase family glycosylhydrolase [Gemmatimonadales bacterium]